jgi:N-acetylated-alpha-linked acidic dipeptidase
VTFAAITPVRQRERGRGGSGVQRPGVQALRLLGAFLGAAVLLAAAAPAPPLPGYTVVAGSQERVDEARFLDLPSAQGALDAAAIFGAHPHYAGTPADYRLAVFTRDRLREYGFDARLESFTARVDTPRALVLELYADGKPFVRRNGLRRQKGAPPLGLDLRERGDDADPATHDPAVGLPFNADSADGDVFAPLVYARRGLPEDFAALARGGVDVRGAVVLIRYGAAFRGSLVQNAQQAGAAGAILYDDPADDGFARGAAYPDGPWRPSASVQRGALGPGIRIPVLPISADNASVLLRALRGPSGPPGWAGALDAPYPLARGPAAVHLRVQLNRKTTTLWNTIGVLHGTLPVQSVIVGAHRDAWVYGVGDNGAGAITVLEAARGLGNLARGGWRPQRTVVVALWDGEEQGLLGSAAFSRAHAGELRRGCIAYLNADENVTGTRIDAAAVGALAPTIVAAASAVQNPARYTTTMDDRWRAQRGVEAIAAPGGGSDHASFLFGFGTPVAEIGLDGPFGPYHSSYDTLDYAKTWSDPGFALHRTAAQLYGLVAMRLADAQRVPYAFSAYLPALRSGLHRLAARAARDRRALDLAPLAGALDAFAQSARRADAATALGLDGDDARALAAAQEIDAVTYGGDGYSSIAFPQVTAAYARRDDAALRNALANVQAALASASTDLR